MRPSPLKDTMFCFYDDGLHVLLYYNGRTDRASLQQLLVLLLRKQTRG